MQAVLEALFGSKIGIVPIGGHERGRSRQCGEMTSIPVLAGRLYERLIVSGD